MEPGRRDAERRDKPALEIPDQRRHANQAELELCSNRAATRADLLKSREKRHGLIVLICRNFASSRNLQQTIALSSHVRGRWFEPSIAHSERPANAGKVETPDFRVGGWLERRGEPAPASC